MPRLKLNSISGAIRSVRIRLHKSVNVEEILIILYFINIKFVKFFLLKIDQKSINIRIINDKVHSWTRSQRSLNQTKY